MYWIKLVGVIVMVSAIAHFWLNEVRHMIQDALVHKVKPEVFKFRQWWNNKPFNCVACLSMWSSIICFILLGEPLVFGIYLLSIYLDKE